MMEININLFHERPMFAFRCSKTARKKIKKAAKDMKMDVEAFILAAVQEYMCQEHYISLRKLRRILRPDTLVFIRSFGNEDPSNIEVVKPLEEIETEYDDWKVKEVSVKYFEIDPEERDVLFIELEEVFF